MKNTSLLRIIGIIFAILLILSSLELVIYYVYQWKKTDIHNDYKTQNIKRENLNSYNKKYIINKSIIKNQKKNFEILKLNKKSKVKQNNARLVLVLDPSHGGDDSGLIWQFKNRTYQEKQIVLEFALSLAIELRKLGQNVVLTRSDDYNVSIENRYDKVVAYTNVLYLPIIVSKTNEDSGGICFLGTSWKQSNIDIEQNENKKFNIKSYDNTKDIKILENEDFLFNKLKLLLDYQNIARCKVLFATRHKFGHFSLFNETTSLILSLGFVNNYRDKVVLENNEHLKNRSKILAQILYKALEEYKKYLKGTFPLENGNFQ